ncbi:hypothetical protein BDB00DRAFT_774987 [Zychaea mexicana]|uniref:uncharacterized protein n=1 Tax=Zychaea mexicana TaxID=64656 RepID=UPI0022FE9C79|nr:uncharacterized protein BDB00DRAFT_774987 [Zychaea mexicana]KAI9484409.1 hypothetical protein BDB00DRAFT_774987 [Zychaea mexicana]
MLLLLWSLLLVCLTASSQAYKPLSPAALSTLKDQHHLVQEYSEPLFIPRIAGTPGNAKVRSIIVDHFKSLQWEVTLDTFTAATPVGAVEFSNIVATYNPKAQKRLVFSAHYDSKYYEDFEFIGATDSAVPCAMLMELGVALDDALRRVGKSSDTTLQLVFFDGEEAFVRWTEEDSIYGAKHLAEKWHSTGDLEKIDVLVLLDLLGAPNPSLPNYYPSTSWLFEKLVEVEQRLYNTQMFDSNHILTYKGYVMQDDHLPFLQRGVDIIHAIPYPFPEVWHQQQDTPDRIDFRVSQALSIIFRCFVAEYLELPINIYHSEL